MKKEKTWPFENGGYLTGRQLFDILLLKRKDRLEEGMRDISSEEMTQDYLETTYREFLSESVLGLSDEEKRFLMDRDRESENRAGALESIIAFTDWEIRTGSFCSYGNVHAVEASADMKNYKKLDFLRPKNSDEEERIIRVLTIVITGKELTMAEPSIKTDVFEAVRPPASRAWGMKLKGQGGLGNEKHII